MSTVNTTRLSRLKRSTSSSISSSSFPAEPPVDRLGQQGDGERRRLRVDRPHDVAVELLGGAHGGLVGSGELRREVERPDAREAGGAELLVAGEEVGRSGLGRRRQGLRRREPLVELSRADVDVVPQGLAVEQDVERDDPHVGVPLAGVEEIRRGVEDDRRVAPG